jgi:hypothetical protein
MSLELLHVEWCCENEMGEFSSHGEGFNEHILDVDNDKHYEKYDEPEDIENPFYYSVKPIGSFMEQLYEDDNDFVCDELSGPCIIGEIKRQRTEPELNGKNLLQAMKWVKPFVGEMVLVYDVNVVQTNHQMDPEEWDVEINCVGVLGQDYKLNKVEYEK